MPRRLALRRGRGESGQSIVEFALILPLIVLLMAIAFTGWDAMQQTIRLTSAARAGALQAAHDLSQYISQNSLTCAQMVPGQSGWTTESPTAWNHATTAVNNEEGSSAFQNSSSASDNYVNMTESTDTNSGLTIYVVSVTVSHKVGAWIPVVSTQHVNTTATARYC
jgi:Flp pilus assembly protein TadG